MALAAALAFTSCDKAEDVIYLLDKISYTSYLRNESGQDVTVIMRPYRHQSVRDCSWFVPKDSVVEIPDTERWGLQQHVFESDTVFFKFTDGTTVLHYYSTLNYPSDNHTYVPAVDNIFYIGLDIPVGKESWQTVKVRPKLYRYEYTIK